MKNRALIFLISSFLSAIGDAVLVFAVPVGLGLETRDMRSAVLMWLIPAVAMFSASFLSSRMEKRVHSARSDYGKLLLGVAALELMISISALVLRTPMQTILLITGFVFLYALAKEGIPRLLYLVSVYRYFVEAEEYSEIAGVSSGLNILAALVGTCFAGWLITRGNWRIALVFDAMTFVVFGLSILLAGRDPRIEVSPNLISAQTTVTPETQRSLEWIKLLVPLLFGVNALIWNYLPLLNERLSVLSSADSIFIIGFLRVPGMLSGLFMKRVLQKISLQKVVMGLPIVYLLGSIAFGAFPSVAFFCALVVLQGLVSGAYWPADFSVRNALSGASLIRFNRTVLRRLAVVQFLGCLLALWVFSPSGPGLSVISEVAMILISWYVFYHFLANRLTPCIAVAFIGAGLVATLSFSGCSHKGTLDEAAVVLPSVSQNMDLRADLTYAATVILNDTSAHFVHVSHDLTVQGDVLSRYEATNAGKNYILDLNPDYRSARGESITADDVAYSIRYYLAKKKVISGALSAIEGAAACNSIDCRLKGLAVQSPAQLRVTLANPDLRWVEKLVSPWLLILKRGKPEIETIGSCVIPYQTGRSTVTACDSAGVHMKIGDQSVVVTSKGAEGGRSSTLLTESPSQEISPSLTVLAAFANPNSKRLTERERVRLLSVIRSKARTISASLHLKFAALLTPEWMGVSVPTDLTTIVPKSDKGCGSGSPIKILLDTSLPKLPLLRENLASAIGCPVEFSITNADTYFQEFAKSDIGIAWFTPDFLDLYDVFTPFDCSPTNACQFDWHDSVLQRGIQKIRQSGFSGEADKNTALEIERMLLTKGYAAPIAEMNWWIRKSDGSILSIHPAGLFQIRVSDFL